jgi:tripartite-type tricarboxylate transporter receptor subunit TctC
VIAPFIGGSPPYDALKDFAPVTLIARSAVLVVAGPKFKGTSIADLIAVAKREPGRLTSPLPASVDRRISPPNCSRRRRASTC